MTQNYGGRVELTDFYEHIIKDSQFGIKLWNFRERPCGFEEQREIFSEEQVDGYFPIFCARTNTSKGKVHPIKMLVGLAPSKEEIFDKMYACARELAQKMAQERNYRLEDSTRPARGIPESYPEESELETVAASG